MTRRTFGCSDGVMQTFGPGGHFNQSLEDLAWRDKATVGRSVEAKIQREHGDERANASYELSSALCSRTASSSRRG